MKGYQPTEGIKQPATPKGGSSAEKGTINRMELESLIDRTAVKAAEQTIKQLKKSDKLKHNFTNSFRKTEELLYLYPKLPDVNPVKQKITTALDKIRNDEYFGVIESRYFDGMTLNEISEIYDCKYQTISKKRNKLVKILATEIFPEDVLNELMEK